MPKAVRFHRKSRIRRGVECAAFKLENPSDNLSLMIDQDTGELVAIERKSRNRGNTILYKLERSLGNKLSDSLLVIEERNLGRNE